MNVVSKVASGIKSMVSIEKSMSQVQASWRFLNNDIVDIKIENEPVVQKGIEEINLRCNKYCLVAHDWSEIDYKKHNGKEELLEKRGNNSTHPIKINHINFSYNTTHEKTNNKTTIFH